MSVRHRSERFFVTSAKEEKIASGDESETR